MKRVLSAIIILPITLAVFLLGNDYVVDVFCGNSSFKKYI